MARGYIISLSSLLLSIWLVALPSAAAPRGGLFDGITPMKAAAQTTPPLTPPRQPDCPEILSRIHVTQNPYDTLSSHKCADKFEATICYQSHLLFHTAEGRIVRENECCGAEAKTDCVDVCTKSRCNIPGVDCVMSQCNGSAPECRPRWYIGGVDVSSYCLLWPDNPFTNQLPHLAQNLP